MRPRFLVLMLVAAGCVVSAVPASGKVISLSEARRLYKSTCLRGPGPDSVIVGTSHADRINGTRGADRILALGGDDRIAGQGGFDCIDAGAGRDRIFEAGQDRIIGGAGNDRIYALGDGTHVDCGAGRDRAFVSPDAVRFATFHGCETVVRVLRVCCPPPAKAGLDPGPVRSRRR